MLAAASAILADEPAKRIKLPSGKNDITAGEALYQSHCALCHGTTGGGGRGPLLAQPKLRRATDDTSLFKVIQEGIPGTEMPGAWQMDDKELRQTAAYIRSLGRVSMKPVAGDVTHGRQVYEAQGCATCHTIKGAGTPMGPDLSAIGARRSAAYLSEAILDPESNVPNDFLQVRVTPANGPAITGARLSEDTFTLQLRDYSGRLHAFWKRDVKEIQKERGKSPMPSYKTKLNDADRTDLIAYLASLREEQ
jgi:cytochrome c oxidase cbb3-type subunit III